MMMYEVNVVENDLITGRYYFTNEDNMISFFYRHYEADKMLEEKGYSSYTNEEHKYRESVTTFFDNEYNKIIKVYQVSREIS